MVAVARQSIVTNANARQATQAIDAKWMWTNARIIRVEMEPRVKMERTPTRASVLWDFPDTIVKSMTTTAKPGRKVFLFEKTLYCIHQIFL